MTHNPASVAAVATALLLAAAPEASALPEPDPITVGTVDEGQLSIDAASIRTRGGWRRGWRQVQSTIKLAQPVLYAAREVAQEVQTQDWDCSKARYRVTLRVFRTADGQFVRSERAIGAWSAVPQEGSERRAFEMICPAESSPVTADNPP